MPSDAAGDENFFAVWIGGSQPTADQFVAAKFNRQANRSRSNRVAGAYVAALTGILRNYQLKQFIHVILQPEPPHDLDIFSRMMRGRTQRESLIDPLGQYGIRCVAAIQSHHKLRQDHLQFFFRPGKVPQQQPHDVWHAGRVLKIECPQQRQRL